ncbi:MAG: GntR family transcriptional regulator [Acidimicrobiales bacterium]|nr:GntR family transcriptional regulator [Acidimicrobiales bacterium]
MASTDESVTDSLRDDILGAVFSPGDRLVELQLTDRYGCGRATIRSALVALEAEGLISREANRGATVRRISVDEAIQITEARSALESLIAKHAARNASEAERAEILSLIDQMRAAVADNEAIGYSSLNRVFHRRLREISGHGVAADLVDNLRNRAAHHQYRLALMPGRPAESVDQHAAIAEAVASGNEDDAAGAMQAHLASVVATLRQWGHVLTA